MHHRDGFLNINGIFEGRFDIVLTNPPFGSSVEATDIIHQEDVEVSEEQYDHLVKIYGEDGYEASQARLRAKVGKPITSLFTLPRGKEPKVKTEILFIERCLNLLKDGGRLGIVLPEGIFNNPSLAYVREFCEERAQIMAVVSLPQDTFTSAKAEVKASLLFLRKFTQEERASFDQFKAEAVDEADQHYAPVIAAESKRTEALILTAKKLSDSDRPKELRRDFTAFVRDIDRKKKARIRQTLRMQFDYPVFMAEAERVGITATGDEDKNELVPGNLPAEVDESVLESYLRFKKKPSAFTFDLVNE